MTTTNNNEAAYDSISGGQVGWQEANFDLNEYKANFDFRWPRMMI